MSMQQASKVSLISHPQVFLAIMFLQFCNLPRNVSSQHNGISMKKMVHTTSSCDNRGTLFIGSMDLLDG